MRHTSSAAVGSDPRVVQAIRPVLERLEARVFLAATPLDVNTIQTRLRALGYPEVDGDLLAVTGTMNADTRHAIGLFNSATTPSGYKHITSTKIAKQELLLSDAAPRWVEIIETGTGYKVNLSSTGGEQTEKWGTNWAQEFITKFGQLWDATVSSPHPVLGVQGVGLKQGGNTPDHATHETGMQVDYDTESSNYSKEGTLNQPFYRVHQIGSKKYVAAATPTDAAGANHVISAINGGKAHTNGSASSTLRLTDSPDLTPILAESAAWIYLNTPKQRQVLKILSKDDTAKTVTVDGSVNIASGSAATYVLYYATPKSGSLTRALVHNSVNYDKRPERLRGIKGLIVDNPDLDGDGILNEAGDEYDLEVIRKQINIVKQFINGGVTTPSGVTVSRVLYNDPRLWDQHVMWAPTHGGHYHVELLPPGVGKTGPISPEQGGKIAQGVQGVGNWIDELKNSDLFTTPLNFLGGNGGDDSASSAAMSAAMSILSAELTSTDPASALLDAIPPLTLADVLPLKQALLERLYEPVQAYLATAGATAEGLANIIRDISARAGDLNVFVDPASVAAHVLGNELSFDVTLVAERTIRKPIVLGAEADALGLRVGTGSQIDAEFRFTLDMTFGIDNTAGLAAAESFFIRVREAKATADVHVHDLDLNLNVGILNASVTGGAVDLEAAVNLSLANPDDDPLGNITLSELQGTSFGTLVDLQQESSLLATLPLTASVGSTTLPGNPTIGVADDNLFDTNAPSITLSDFDPLSAFNNLSPATFLAALRSLASALTDAARGLDIPGGIPLIESKLSELADIAGSVERFIERLHDAEWDSLRSYAAAAVPGSFVLTHGAKFAVAIGDGELTEVTVPASATTGNTSVNDLVDDVNDALEALGLHTAVVAEAVGGKLSLKAAEADAKLTLRYRATDAGMKALGFDAPLGQLRSAFEDIAGLQKVLAEAMGVAENAVGLQYDAVTKQLAFTLDLEIALLDKHVHLDLSDGFGPLAVVGEVQATINGSLKLNASVEIDLSDPLAGDPLALLDVITIGDDASIRGEFNVEIEPLDLGAALGPIALTLKSLLPATLNISSSLELTTGTDGRISLADLAANPTAYLPSFPTITGSGAGAVTLGSNGLVPDFNASYSFAIDSSSGTPNVTFDVDATELDELLQGISSLSSASVADLLKQLVNALKQFGAFDKKLPLIDKSINQILAIGEKLQQTADDLLGAFGADQISAALVLAAKELDLVDPTILDPDSDGVIRFGETLVKATASELQQQALDALQTAYATLNGNAVQTLIDSSLSALVARLEALKADPKVAAALDEAKAAIPSLQTIEAKIESLLGLGADDLKLELKDGELIVNLHWGFTNAGGNLDLGFEIGEQGLVSFESGGSVNLDVDGSIDLNFGMSLAEKSLFLLDGTKVELTAGSNSTITAVAKILGIEIGMDGTLTLQNAALDGPAALKLSLTGGRVPISSLTPGSFISTSDGTLAANINIGGPTAPGGTLAGSFNFDTGASSLVLGPEADQPGKLLNYLFQGAFNLDTLFAGIEALLNSVRDGFLNQILSKVPLIGDNIAGAVAFVDALHAKFEDVKQQLKDLIDTATPTVAEIEAKIEDLLKALPQVDDTTVEATVPDFTTSSDPVLIKFRLAETIETNPGFDIGLGGVGLNFSTDVGVLLKLGYAVDVSVGFDKATGFFYELNADDTPEIRLTELTLALDAGASLQAQLAFLKFRATNQPSLGGTGFSITGGGIDLTGTGRIGITKFADASLYDIQLPTINADVNLKLEAQLLNLPPLSTHFHVDWAYDLGGVNSDSNLVVEFRDITLDLGDMFKKTIAPILKQVEKAVAPLKPILDFLQSEVPIVSQLSRKFGGDKVTFADIGGALGEGFGDVVEALGTLVDIGALAAAFNDPDGGIRLGSFKFDSAKAAGSTQAKAEDGALTVDEDDGQTSEETGGLLDSLEDIGLAFPILSGDAIVKLLLGQDVDLITYTGPDFQGEGGLSYTFGPLLPPVPLFARIFGRLGAAGDFLNFGMDTRGIRTKNFLNGFYFNDAAGEPEFRLFAEVGAGAELNVVVARAGVEGGLAANITADWNDPNNDGKFYLDELASQAARGLECVFELGGSFTAFFRAYAKLGFDTPFGFVTIFSGSVTLAEITLFDFEHSCPPLPPPNLADLEGSTLKLNVGSRAHLRQPGVSIDDAELLTVRYIEQLDQYEVSGYGTAEYFDADDVSEIWGNAGNQDDEIKVEESVTVPVTLLGGAGNDMLTGGSGDDSLVGEGGADQLVGNAGNDVLDGGDDADAIYGGAGGDTIRGGEGDDAIYGGNAGDDLGDLADSIDAGGGNDDARGGLGNDTIRGGAGNDQLRGEDDNDSLYGDADMDLINGGAGADLIEGGDGDDLLFGNGEVLSGARVDGNDTIHGQGGSDTIEDDAGDDLLYGGDNNDAVSGGAGKDAIHGDAGEDTLDGAAGDDSMYGGAGNDSMRGAAGADYMEGNAGHDTMFGGDNDDRMIGGSTVADPDGNDSISGEAGNDLILADNGILGSVTLLGGAGGNDTVFGGGGSDTVFGQGGNDLIDGGAEADTLYGNSGTDTVLGGEGADSIEGGGGNDTLAGGSGDDSILGGSKNDLELAADGSDSITGESGADIILGDNGRITSSTDAASDPANGGGADSIYGGAGSDVIMGGVLADLLFGGTEADLIMGDHGQLDPSLALNLYFISIHMAAANGGNDTISGDAGDDSVLGQQGSDRMLGGDGDDDLIGGHNVAGGDDAGDAIDGGAGSDAIAGDNATIVRRTDSASPNVRVLIGSTLYDVDFKPAVGTDAQQNPNGSIGRDITLLDHTATTGSALYGDDSIAGGAGDDSAFGQLGDDTIRGDGAINSAGAPIASANSAEDGDDYIEGNGGEDTLYGDLGQDDLIGGSSNLFGLTDSSLRPDGSDSIFGGTGADVARNSAGDTSTNGHANDADVIAGDNAVIFRVVDSSGDFIEFTYDNYGSLKIIPRAVELLDYTLGGSTDDIGAADVIHGEAGDDEIHGQTGNDVLFGEGQDDNIYGQSGHDRIYGGSGEDGVVGDDGRIITTRNGLTETLYGLTSPNAETFISMPGNTTGAWEYISGRLNKSVVLQAYETGGNDVIYGGLGDDFLHGGAGDDGISGAEATEDFYNEDAVTGVNLLGYDPVTRKLAAYDANSPMTKIAGFFLNFDAADTSGAKIEDGKDRIFGDLGQDWLVGGTGKDRIFGGMGDDLMNADDNHDTAGGLNNTPDAPEYADGDFVFGGGGLDVLIGNTGNDRMYDWNGEFNTFLVPFSPFGHPSVNRLPSPHIRAFLLDLGRFSGADATRVEPHGELGLVSQNDPEWHDQQGPPRDPQAGNTSSSQRDTRGGFEDDRGTSLPLAGAAAPAPIVASLSAMTSSAAEVQVDPTIAGRSALFVMGTNGNDVIDISAGSTAATIRVFINGTLIGEYARGTGAGSIGRVIVYGYDGADRITIDSNLGALDSLVYGGAGNDTMVGGAGADFIVGGDGNDSIDGGDGADILVGGQGTDAVNGGRGDDVLIGGDYEHADDLNVATAAVATWTSSATYAARVAALRSAGTSTGIIFSSTSIMNDLQSDTLTGGLAGGDSDWFWGDSLDVMDQTKKEVLN